MIRIAAVDIGGARLRGFASDVPPVLRPFDLDRRPHDLSVELSALLAKLGNFDALAVSLAGEQWESFESRKDCALHVLASVKAAAVRCCPGSAAGGRKRGWPEVLVWTHDGDLIALSDALEEPLPASGASWLALATLAGRLVPEGKAVLVDVGASATQIVPLRQGRPTPRGRTETERLLSGELVSLGVRRTPVATIASQLPYRGRQCPIWRTGPAVTADAYRTLRLIEEEAVDPDSSDGQSATRARSRDRLARMLRTDWTSFGEDDSLAVAGHVYEEQGRLLREALHRVAGESLETACAAVISGSGEFLARKALEGSGARVVSVKETLGEKISEAGTAYAVWRLASQKLDEGPLESPPCGGP